MRFTALVVTWASVSGATFPTSQTGESSVDLSVGLGGQVVALDEPFEYVASVANSGPAAAENATLSILPPESYEISESIATRGVLTEVRTFYGARFFTLAVERLERNETVAVTIRGTTRAPSGQASSYWSLIATSQSPEAYPFDNYLTTGADAGYRPKIVSVDAERSRDGALLLVIEGEHFDPMARVTFDTCGLMSIRHVRCKSDRELIVSGTEVESCVPRGRVVVVYVTNPGPLTASFTFTR